MVCPTGLLSVMFFTACPGQNASLVSWVPHLERGTEGNAGLLGHPEGEPSEPQAGGSGPRCDVPMQQLLEKATHPAV